MRIPNKHGIMRPKFKIPKDGYRLFVAFRNLQPHIKRQALHHQGVCNNQDTNPQIMAACQCAKIK